MELVTYDLPWKPATIMPVGDIQWFGDDHEVALEKLRAHIAWGVERGAWFIGMGDYIDAFSPSNRQRLKAAAMYDNANRVLDEAARNLVKELYERALKPSAGRWLGLLAGHHYAELRDGTTTDQMLAGLLKTRHLGDCAYVRLRFRRDPAHRTTSGAVLIWAHHGQGAGKSIAAPVQKLESMPATFEGDIFLMGHQSKIVAAPMDRCFPTWPRLDGVQPPRIYHKTVLLVGTGSFMRGYVEGRREGLTPAGTYVEKGMMRPVSLGAPVITVTPRVKEVARESDSRPKPHRKGQYREHSSVWLPDLRVSL